MFTCRFQEAVVLKRIVDALYELITDTQLVITKDGITLQGMCSAHVSMVSLVLKCEGFSNYECDKDATIGINLLSLSKVLKLSSNDDELTLKLQDGSDYLSITSSSKNKDKNINIDLSLMDLNQELLEIPETDYSIVCQFTSVEFKRIISDLSAIGDTVVISTEPTKGASIFSTKGDYGNADISISNKELINCDKLSQSFAIRYLSLFTKATPLSPNVTIHLDTNMPLFIVYDIGKYGSITYYIAPKVEDEES